MKITNLHKRLFPFPAERVGALIDTLATDNDLLWPSAVWPPMRFDAPLGIGARGGHGPIRYHVEFYEPGRLIRFRIAHPPCLKNAVHWFEVLPQGEGRCILHHVLELDCSGRAWISWPLVWRPLHDACVEDALARAEDQLELSPTLSSWSGWVRVLRCLLSGGRAPGQDRLLQNATGKTD